MRIRCICSCLSFDVLQTTACDQIWTHTNTHITDANLPRVHTCLITAWLYLRSCQHRRSPSSCTNPCRSCLSTPFSYITRAFDSTSKAKVGFHSAVREALVQPGWEQLSGLPAEELAITLLLFGSILFQLPVSFSFSSSFFFPLSLAYDLCTGSGSGTFSAALACGYFRSVTFQVVCSTLLVHFPYSGKQGLLSARNR